MDDRAGRVTRRVLLGGVALLTATGAQSRPDPVDFIRSLYGLPDPGAALSDELRRLLAIDARRTRPLLGIHWLGGAAGRGAVVQLTDVSLVRAWPSKRDAASANGYDAGPIVSSAFRYGEFSAARVFDLAPKGGGWQIADVIVFPQDFSILERLTGGRRRLSHPVHGGIPGYRPPPGPPQSMLPPVMPH